MPKRTEDITDVIVCEAVLNIRAANSIEVATDFLLAFCERYRNNYNTVKFRKYLDENRKRYLEHGKKWRETHKEEYARGRSIKGKSTRWQRALEKANMDLENLNDKQKNSYKNLLSLLIYMT